ncbi:MAG: GMP synthase (glutamine-hydrolyzing), partial [Clostridiales bacterium]|nr:GMP synthase (glutamine-hydrolyzing) [Clostridiales bacterium]
TKGVENCERLLQCARRFSLPPQLFAFCRAEDVAVGFAHESLPLYGVQFQAERNDMEGAMLLRNFALAVCGCTTWWDEDAFATRAVEEIGRVVGEGRAVCSMTGGITSGVSALLAYKALGRQLKCVFVDTGLLRDNESEDFLVFYRDQIGMDITRVSAQDRFLQALRGVREAEEKRQVIHELMHSILRDTIDKMGRFDAVIRGTCYNDIMTGQISGKIVSDGSIPEIRPVRELFKDEIRRVGDYLGIPQDIVSRQPFPGSGLALRILDEVTPERLKVLRAADAIFRSEVQRSGAGKRLWQYFAVLSLMPDSGEKYVICLRAVHASDHSLAYAARLPYEVTENTVERILRELPQVRRVVYDLTPSGNYAGIEWQ